MPGQLRVDERVVRIEQFNNAAILSPQVIAEERGFGFHGIAQARVNVGNWFCDGTPSADAEAAASTSGSSS